ncbi:hypothetical protein [Mogibacterium diversum]
MGVYDERIIRATKFEYADIINRVRPIHKTDRFSYKYPRMSNEKRAKIFAPFAALSGYDDALAEKEVIYDIKRVLTDDEYFDLDCKIATIYEKCSNSILARENGVEVRILYFEQLADDELHGRYLEVIGLVTKVRPDKGTITILDKEISLRSIYKLEILNAMGIEPQDE